MVNKCCAPGCRSNYVSKKGTTKVTTFLFKKNGFTTRMVKKIPRDFTVTNNTVICAEHFEEDDIIRYKPNTNPKVSI